MRYIGALKFPGVLQRHFAHPVESRCVWPSAGLSLTLTRRPVTALQIPAVPEIDQLVIARSKRGGARWREPASTSRLFM